MTQSNLMRDEAGKETLEGPWKTMVNLSNVYPSDNRFGRKPKHFLHPQMRTSIRFHKELRITLLAMNFYAFHGCPLLYFLSWVAIGFFAHSKIPS
jgi:DNA phosphorothioation-dependent restriction protein DptG